MISITISDPKCLDAIIVPRGGITLTIIAGEGQNIALSFPTDEKFKAFRTSLNDLKPKPLPFD